MIDTSSGSINPKGELTRAQFAKYLMNYDINYNGGTGKSNYNITAIQNPGITQPTASTATPTKSINEIAAEVINGDWGNGDERRQRLEAASYNYNEVQKAVNSQFTYTPSYSSSGSGSGGGTKPATTTKTTVSEGAKARFRTNGGKENAKARYAQSVATSPNMHYNQGNIH